MSWRPPYARAADAHTPRLDPYRDRGAILSDGEGVVGKMYIQIQTWWNHTGGRLWWKRWSKPYEVPYGLMKSRTWGWDDWVGSPDDLDQDLADWARNRFRYRGEMLVVEWLDDRASRQLRDDLGVGPG